jgi:hypothetical protein
MRRVKSQAITVSERQPWRRGSARNDGRSTMVRSGPDQQVADEQRVPSEFRVDASAHPRFRIGAGVEILGEQFAAARVFDEVGEQHVEVLAAHCSVAVPPDRVFGRRVADDRFVLRAASGVDAGLGDQRAALRDDRLVAADRLGVELRRLKIPVYRGELLKAESRSAVSGVEDASLLHSPLVIEES